MLAICSSRVSWRYSARRIPTRALSHVLDTGSRGARLARSSGPTWAMDESIEDDVRMAGLACSAKSTPAGLAVGSATPVSLFTPATERALRKAKPSLVAFDSQGTETCARHRRQSNWLRSFERAAVRRRRVPVGPTAQRPRPLALNQEQKLIASANRSDKSDQKCRPAGETSHLDRAGGRGGVPNGVPGPRIGLAAPTNEKRQKRRATDE
jgi:hypothetical protein